eukprot:gene27138-35646_t
MVLLESFDCTFSKPRGVAAIEMTIEQDGQESGISDRNHQEYEHGESKEE